MEHKNTEGSKINYEKLYDRITSVNNLENTINMKNMINRLKGSTLLVATGGSKVVANYLKLLLENLSIICDLIEPRDYFYKSNVKLYDNLIVVLLVVNLMVLVKY